MAGVEVATKISELVATNPPGSDSKSEGDNHLRLIKAVLQDVFDDADEGTVELIAAHFRARWDSTTSTVYLESLDDTGDVLFALAMKDGGLTTNLGNPVIVVGADGIERARLTAVETAGQGGLTLLAKDETGDVKGSLAINSTGLEVAPDDQTKILQFDQSRQTTATTRKLYVPAKALDGSFSLWEPVFKRYYTAQLVNDVVADLSEFFALRFTLHGIGAASFVAGIQFSSDNGASFDTAVFVTQQQMFATGAVAPLANQITSSIFAIGTVQVGFTSAHLVMGGFNKAMVKHGVGQYAVYDGAQFTTAAPQQIHGNSVVRNAFRFAQSSAVNFTGLITAEGIRA